MALIGTFASLSSRGFGFLTQASVIYPFMGQQSTATASVYGGTTVLNMTSIPVQPTNVSAKAIGLAVDGTFIAQASNQYSLNGGASWNSWMTPGQYTPSGMPFGINGGIAYNPTAKRAMSFNVDYNFKGSYFYASPTSVTSTGSVVGASSTGLGGGSTVNNIIYSPALNTFYLMNFGNSISLSWAVDGTTGTGGSSAAGSAPGNFRAGISDDGYPIQAQFAGFGTTFYLRKYLSSDFSISTSYGTISGADVNAQIHSPWFWAPVNNKYVHAAGGSNGNTLNFSSASLANPQAYTGIGSQLLPFAVGISSANFIEQTNGTLWVFGLYTANTGKQNFNALYTYYSTDGGVSWTASGIGPFAALAKNFTP
jgi:hypothetical protein